MYTFPFKLSLLSLHATACAAQLLFAHQAPCDSVSEAFNSVDTRRRVYTLYAMAGPGASPWAMGSVDWTADEPLDVGAGNLFKTFPGRRCPAATLRVMVFKLTRTKSFKIHQKPRRFSSLFEDF